MRTAGHYCINNNVIIQIITLVSIIISVIFGKDKGNKKKLHYNYYNCN